MAEPKPLATLTSGLLARKGAAQPAMRRPMLGFGRMSGQAVQQDDLGWNDMGFDVEPASAPAEESHVVIGLTPMPLPVPAVPTVPAVVIEREELVERITGKPAEREVAPKSITSAPRKAAFTLRLDADRHLRLRLASAVTGRSSQQIVTQALDDFLNNLPELDRLTQQLPRSRGDQ